MSSNKKYWKSVEELKDNSTLVESLKNNEFVEAIPTDEFLGDKESLSNSSTTRRDFLKYVGFSTAAASLAACEGPVVKSIPYVVQPDQIIPGIADYYATTMFDGFDFANVLVKTREGRPIKIENNKINDHAFSANARVHASVLSMYDNKRLKTPTIGGAVATWSKAIADIAKSVEEANAGNKEVVFLTGTIASPSTLSLLADLKVKFPAVNHVVYDAVSESSALDAFEKVYGERALASYHFDKASFIVSLGADFLGDWQGGGYDASYAKGRVPKAGKMSKHVQIESNLTLSGAAADKRIPMSVSDQKLAMLKIYSAVSGNMMNVAKFNNDSAVLKIAEQLKSAGSKGLFVTGLDDVDAQILAIAINLAIGSESFDTTNTRQVRKGSKQALKDLVSKMKSGSVHTLIMNQVNPLYSYFDAKGFEEGMKKVKLSVSHTLKLDETASATSMALPAPHYLESWGDLELVKGQYSIVQPTIRPLYDTKQFEELLLSLNGIDSSYYDYLKKSWSSNALVSKSWNQLVHDGVYIAEVENTKVPNEAVFSIATSSLKQAKSSQGFELVLYTKVGMGDGQQANNPWLQEFPDPITRVSWDNYLTISQADADEKGLENFNVANGGLDGSYVNLKVGNKTIEKVPVFIQPGQAKGTVGLALGYGRKASIQEEMQVGVNAYELYQDLNLVQNCTFEKAEGNHEFACVQLQKTLMGRGDIIKETTLEIFNSKDAKHWNLPAMVSLDHKPIEATKVDLWESFDRSVGHHFNLSIDLNACTGCGACVIACHAENNVPVVGKSEVRRSRDMHWLRIDRYYSSEDTFAGDNEKKENFDGLFGDNGSLGGFGQMENPADNPQVAFQPVMCQHCNHAPCETVCPVAATSHSRQGHNHMAYNRCVGTRYCANNCPYKVRRFNWFLYNNNDEFDFHMNNDLGKMVLNPDVNVRSRGVMEKCSFCVQMTQASILKAKKEGRFVSDDEFQTACSNACSTGAMVFGDVNNKESEVAKLAEDERMYHLLEHVGTKPNVFYHVKVRNT
uniref:TAT-variant-translocated molybdopterin oxidoreductase n=1 Tax=Flavobacterium sp. TaxID=239 RepID=UPI004049A7B5